MTDIFEHIKIAPHFGDTHPDGYTVYAGPLSDSWAKWHGNRQYSGIVIICDENTASCCLPIFLTKTGIDAFSLIVTKSGEQNKNLQSCQQIWTEMLNICADRKSLCINLGGGVVGDMGGFCAATFKRGFDFVQVPTTLLAQVDASVGGKLGIDFETLKNGIGVFQNPEAVFIDTVFLRTLPERELRSAYAEMFKHALIGSEQEWATMCHWAPAVDAQLLSRITASLRIKKVYFDKDPFERNVRKSLNLGHTIGHAVESHFLEMGQPILHGEAIAAGLVCELYLSVIDCGLPSEILEKSIQALKGVFSPLPISEGMFINLLNLMQQDKKNENGQINFTLLEKPGKPKINRTVDSALIISSLKFYIKNYTN